MPKESLAFRVVARVLAWLGCERFDIEDAANGKYMTRWTLWGKRQGGPGRVRVFLHYFHRSDKDEAFHDHPWTFRSFILWGGYHEETPEGTRWIRPWSLNRRPATWRHRVVLARGVHPWTLVLVGEKERTWGYTCRNGAWIWYKDYHRWQDEGRQPCG